MKATLLTLTLLFLSSAFAGTNQFCQSPLEYTCSNAIVSGQRREFNINAIEEGIKNQAFNLMKRDLSDDQDISGLNNYNEIESLSPARKRKQAQKIFYLKIRILFGSYMAQNHVPSDLGVSYIKEALIREVNQSSNIPSNIKSQITSTINSTRLISFQSDIEESTIGDVHALYSGCSKKNFVDNAFATEIHRQKVVLVCPGEIIGTIEDLKEKNISAQYIPLALAMTLGHEFSHHFDYRYFPEIYSTLFQDISNHHGDLAQTPVGYMSEISADSWGLKTFKNLASYLSTSSLYSQLISSSLNDLCGSEDDGEHPTGDFRINYLATKFLCQ